MTADALVSRHTESHPCNANAVRPQRIPAVTATEVPRPSARDALTHGW